MYTYDGPPMTQEVSIWICLQQNISKSIDESPFSHISLGKVPFLGDMFQCLSSPSHGTPYKLVGGIPSPLKK